MKYMQFVGIGKHIDIVYHYENCINFSIEANYSIKHDIPKCIFFYTISLVPHNRENKPKLCL